MIRLGTILFSAAALLAAGPVFAEWAVPEASLRFDFTVQFPPSVPVAGVLVFIPDGGLLPTPAPRASVLDGAGKTIEFDYLWHNPQEGLALVIAPPPSPAFSVYVGRQSRITRNEHAAFKPGPLFYVKLGNASLETATRLTSGFPPCRDGLMGSASLIGQQGNPLGPDRDFSGWLSAWLQTDKPGRYYLATISDEGSLVRLDGKTVAEWPGLHTRREGAKGQFGSFIDLAAGPHLVDYFYFNIDGPSEAQLCWRLPASPNALPSLVPASAYLHSGSSRLNGVTERDGAPVAVPAAPCETYFWFGDQPANLHRLEARCVDRNPPNTVYEWKLDDGTIVRERSFPWIFEGAAPRAVTLTARSGNRSTTASCAVRLPATPPAARLNNPDHRALFRAALLARCRATPPPNRPCKDWTPGLWQLLLNVAEPFKGQALLSEIFERSRADLLQRLSPADRAVLEDLFTDNLRYSEPVRAAAWLDRLEREEKDPERKRSWTLAKIEQALYQAGDTNLARKIASSLLAQAPGTEAGAFALVRLGDIEALAGNFDAARAAYAQAQSQAPHKRPAIAADVPAGAGLTSAGLARSRDDPDRRGAEAGGKGLARSRSELEQARASAAEKRRESSDRTPDVFTSGTRADPWKAEAVRGGTYYETIRNLLRDGYLREARAELRNWELELPTEKLGGEYPVAEAEYFMAIRDYSRARLGLRLYRQAVEMSSFLPKAIGMELDCLQKLGNDDEARALAEKASTLFPGHPVADQAGRIRLSAGQGRVNATPSVEAP